MTWRSSPNICPKTKIEISRTHIAITSMSLLDDCACNLQAFLPVEKCTTSPRQLNTLVNHPNRRDSAPDPPPTIYPRMHLCRLLAYLDVSRPAWAVKRPDFVYPFLYNFFAVQSCLSRSQYLEPARKVMIREYILPFLLSLLCDLAILILLCWYLA